MDLIYYFPWGYFYPVSSGAMAVAEQHLNYFRSRGIRPRIVVLGDATLRAQRQAFERHYHWAGDICVIDLQVYPKIDQLLRTWSFTSFLRGHAAIAEIPRFRDYFAWPADIVMLNYVFATPLLDACSPGARRVLETCDILSKASTYPDISTAALQHQLKVEFDLYEMYDLVIMLNQEEAAMAAQRSSTRIEYVPRAVDIVEEREATLRCGEEQYDLIFVGSEHPPNIEGMRCFYEKVFRPHLRRRGITLAIAGTVCNSVGIQDSSVALLGRVGNLRQAYRESKVVVVPLFAGTGISIKTLEAMGQGKPIVTTPCGRRGLEDCDSSLICLPFERDPAQVAERILELVRSPRLREQYGWRAREYAKLHFSAEAYGERMDGLFESALERRLPIAA